MDFKNKSRPLIVGSCGTYRLSSYPKLPTYRPKGRLDYQIIYITALLSPSIFAVFKEKFDAAKAKKAKYNFDAEKKKQKEKVQTVGEAKSES